MYPQGPAAYDRAITVFSPDGRLFQVEYAREAVKRGTTAVGLIYDKGVLLAVDKNVSSKLIVPKSIEKIFQIDEHIGVATSGLVADARRLVEDARVRAQRNRLVYSESISVSALTRDLCDIKQAYTQYGGARPFGTALLIAGVNDKPHLFETDPSGAFTEFTAGAIGMGKREVEKLLEEKFKEKMPRKDAVNLAIISLNSVSEGKIKAENVDMITIEVGGKYSAVTVDEISESIKHLGKELDSQDGKGE
ncbi:MAG: archaeal proteasome endopeptidase complex subunit alpha [Candidatus Altiarchaeales archaeon]|nr:archaeal proteasome endopeptidase complex subunit alpha [Candidatus Altiarchaeales archaeon]MBD3416512.1 archaeal proteasome endopeptidase complex subunit alpha [Candidatus Altiarchaeales archaeon]